MIPKAPTAEGITPHEALMGQLLFAVAHEFMPHVDEAQRQRVLATTVFPSDWQSGEWFP